jgi:hypothetical protein
MEEKMDAKEWAEWLAEEFAAQAEWRRQKAVEFPDDERNNEAALIFDRLSESVGQLDLAILDTFGSLHDEVQDSELWRDWLREIGFHQWPKSAGELIAEFIANRSGTTQ